MMFPRRVKKWGVGLICASLASLLIGGITGILPMPFKSGSLPPAIAATASCQKSAATSSHYKLAANAKTVHWGFFSKNLAPALTVHSKDFVTIETITHHAGDDYDRMIKGDPGIESIYKWTTNEKSIENRGPGVHIMTGPIYVCGAEPGDILEVKILDLAPRPSGNPKYKGKAFGSNAAAWWGFHYKDMSTDPKPREVITIYEVDPTGSRNWAKAVYNYRWTPQVTPDGKTHTTIDYPGIIVDHNKVQEKTKILEGVRIPLRLHVGLMGVAPSEVDTVNSIPPSYFGGNLDNWRIGPGTTMYYPVAVPGALLSAGDAHTTQGDSELVGTAIETSITGTLQIILHKQSKVKGSILEGLDFPLLETPEEWVVHGFTYTNYLKDLGAKAQDEIFQKSSIDRAMRDGATKLRQFLVNGMNLSEDEAYSLITVAADFGITQVVDGNWGVHGIIKKSIFEDRTVKSKPVG
jgi:acetamidase/formamidase